MRFEYHQKKKKKKDDARAIKNILTGEIVIYRAIKRQVDWHISFSLRLLTSAIYLILYSKKIYDDGNRNEPRG